ncbi:MAG: ATP-dependent helicase HrpB [Deltaproteobacteria bacterium]|nr:ATP-dependent helicase HrpB [Deltaproteobacteria bacterium]
MVPLPIDSVMDDIIAAVARPGQAVVVEASPGAGKTTRVPRALLDAGLGADGQIVVLEPRRLAARLAAARVADELGEPLGETVGYQVRFDRRLSDRTRLRFVTEGVLTRQLCGDPELTGVAVVVLDELHERHVHTDLALVLVERLRRTSRPELRLVVMSATLDSRSVAELLGATVVQCPSRAHSVAIEHLPQPSREPLDVQVATAVRRCVRAGLGGHVLVFLPGMAEIQRAADTCRAVADQAGLQIRPLHGVLPARDQDAAVAPSQAHKLILATNVAESSITIDSVTAVVDSGLARVAHQDASSMMTTLRLSRISQASATQRAGRAGRTGDGVCLRLYTEQDHLRQPEYDPPEIERSDLVEPLLALGVAGVTDPGALPWLTPPPADRVARAEDLLRQLGAIAKPGRVTELGRQMARLPIHPRLSRALVEARRLGVAREATVAIALIGEGRDLRRPRRGTRHRRGASLWEQVELYEQAEQGRFQDGVLRQLELDGRAVSACRRATAQLRRLCRPGDGHSGTPAELDRALSLALLAGFPDRVARRVGTERPRADAPIPLAMAGGGRAEVHDPTVIGGEGLCLAVEATERDNRPALVRLALPITVDGLLDALPDQIEDQTELGWNAQRERVEAVGELRYRGLTLDRTTAAARPSAAAGAILLEAARRAGLHEAEQDEGAARLARRAAFVASMGPTVPPLDTEALGGVLAELCEGMVSFAELREVGVARAALAGLTHEQREQLRKLAPERVRLASGRELPVVYPAHGEPFVESYLQDFFGMNDTPRLGGGARPLVLHLWAPNRRAVQVTTDLAGFWARHYPDQRKTLSRRYPKHHWPADPLSAPAKRLKRHL